ncbi:hypothetical protein JDV02_000756 [Purpureocillium takamizusanense]|uniref:Uncharacterized protein n=1 Tax=Purpureocillium takamizusanense TaxID=2060973 RepID=A0A9Q8Q7Y3_9HYPO|nr:uncharacterized protein JDV02_000756 [Purpureocillium takamizusanense]UNI14083.1 hypothetical protein JDV02_000756 [Purpureocillium takamizusanense]
MMPTARTGPLAKRVAAGAGVLTVAEPNAAEQAWHCAKFAGEAHVSTICTVRRCNALRGEWRQRQEDRGSPRCGRSADRGRLGAGSRPGPGFASSTASAPPLTTIHGRIITAADGGSQQMGRWHECNGGICSPVMLSCLPRPASPRRPAACSHCLSVSRSEANPTRSQHVGCCQSQHQQHQRRPKPKAKLQAHARRDRDQLAKTSARMDYCRSIPAKMQPIGGRGKPQGSASFVCHFRCGESKLVFGPRSHAPSPQTERVHGVRCPPVSYVCMLRLWPASQPASQPDGSIDQDRGMTPSNKDPRDVARFQRGQPPDVAPHNDVASAETFGAALPNLDLTRPSAVDQTPSLPLSHSPSLPPIPPGSRA